MTTQERDRIESAIRHIQTSVDIDPWAMEIAVKAMTKQMEDLKNSPTQMSETSDLISRQDAIDLAHELIVPNKYKYSIYNQAINNYCVEIKQLPSAQPEQQWILCSERLPKEYGNYLISTLGDDEPDIGSILPGDKRGWSLCDANGFYWANDKKVIVTAWMPLPEPYREAKKNDE